MIQIVLISIIFSLIIIYLRSINSEISYLATVGAGIIILLLAFDYLNEIFNLFDKLATITKIDSEIYKILLKVIAIGYLVEFGASTIEDFGVKSLADKVVFVGKIVILIVSMPIIYAVINLLGNLIK